MVYTVAVMEADSDANQELVSMLKRAAIRAIEIDKWERIREISPEAVIIGESAGTGGWDLSARIRNESDIPILLLGEGNNELSWVKAVAYGVDCYLAKPFSPGELTARLRALIRRYSGLIETISH